MQTVKVGYYFEVLVYRAANAALTGNGLKKNNNKNHKNQKHFQD